MKRKCKIFGVTGWMLLFVLVIFGVHVCETIVVEASSSILTSKDGLWKYEYVEEDSGETVVCVDEYNGSDRDLVIPGEIDGYEVRYIGRPGGWSYGIDTDRFDSITIPDSVTGLLNAPFFEHCRTLKFLSLGKNYGKHSPYGADINMLKSVDIYDIRAREYRVSPENEVITAVDGVLYSKDMTVLKLYPALKEDTTFTVPNRVTSIDSYAMNNLQYLENLVLPNGLKEIGEYCCEGSSIRSVSLPNNLTKLDHGIFNKTRLESVVIPKTVTQIGALVFAGTPLEEVVIPDTVKSLGVSVFMNCDKLKSITIGSGLESIGGNCFYGLSALETFRISEENQNFKSVKGMLLSKDGSKLIQYAATGNTEFVLPEGVTVIEASACYGMPFNKIIIPDTVVSIGDKAFENCTKAETVYVPSSVNTMGYGVFYGCTSLKTATIDAQVTKIEAVFHYCTSLTDITFSETITDLNDVEFFCQSLRSVHLKASKAPSITYTFYIQGQEPEAEFIKKCSDLRIFVPEDAQGYDKLPWSRMHVVHGDVVAAERLLLNPSSVVLDVGHTVSLQTVVLPEDAVIQDVVWETSDKEIALVDGNGRVEALAAGTARIKVTAGGLSTECVVRVRDNKPAQQFRMKTSGGKASSNYNAQNYYRWSSPMKSYLFEDKEGCLTRVEFMDDKLIYETYDMDSGTLKDSGSVGNELPLTGGFYVSGEFRFVVYGKLNDKQDDSVEVMRIVKYNRDWDRVASCSLYGENTSEPFAAGNLRFVEHGDTLYIRTSHKMYDGHQSNLQVAVDMSVMEIKDTFSAVANIDCGGYVSHSFNQFLRMDGEDLITLDHGDSYPRAAVLIKYPNIKDTTYVDSPVEHHNALEFPGMSGNNTTNASLGGLEVSEHYYIFAGNYINKDNSSIPNIFVNITDRDFLRYKKTRMIYLTDFDADSDVTVSTPQLVKVDEKTFLVLWNELDASGTTVHSQMIDEDGNKVTEEQSFHGFLSDCQPIVQNGQVVWYYTGTKKGDTTPIFCKIAVDGGKTTDNLIDEELNKAEDSGKKDGKDKEREFDGEKRTISVKKGTSHKVGSCQYKVTGTSTVSMTGVKNKKATKVKIPKTVKIGGKTFKVTAIASSAFKNNKKIRSVEIGDNVAFIGTSAFEGCTQLTKVTIGIGVTKIGVSAFKNCKKLGSITIKSAKLKSVGKNALKGVKSTAKIKVPGKKVKLYKKRLKGKGQGSKVKIVK